MTDTTEARRRLAAYLTGCDLDDDETALYARDCAVTYGDLRALLAEGQERGEPSEEEVEAAAKVIAASPLIVDHD